VITDQERALRRRLAGLLCAVGAAAAFGLTIVVQRELATRGLGVTTALGVRFTTASLLLVVVLRLARQRITPAAGERVRALLLGVVGYATEAGLFYLALQRGSAGAVALLFYAYPTLVALLEAASGRSPLTRRTLVALAASTAGAAMVVLAGERVVISSAGVAFALGSAVCFSVYIVLSDRLITRSAPMSTAAAVAGGAGVALLCVAAVTGSYDLPSSEVPLLMVNAAATAVAFALMYAALPRLGAGPTAVVMTLEAFVALVLAVPLLDETLRGWQLLGGAAIVAAAIVVARQKDEGPAHEERGLRRSGSS
jgi:drug/metabolite transporter (DMT)-like permease